MSWLGNKIYWLAGLRFLSRPWRLPGFILLGITVGAGVFVAHISRATSYLSDEPETCINCHVMATQYVTWQHSSHGRVATCNDCHVPHTSLPAHFAFKAKDGLWHATVFTMRWEPQVIRLSKGAVAVVEDNCRRCHADLLQNVQLAAHSLGDLRCWECHREVPHGSVRSLAAAPGVLQPQLPPVHNSLQEPTIGGRPARPDKDSTHD